MKHRCFAPGCKCPIRPKTLMCRAHWRMVPTEIQEEVYTHFYSKDTTAWARAAMKARAAVAQQQEQATP